MSLGSRPTAVSGMFHTPNSPRGRPSNAHRPPPSQGRQRPIACDSPPHAQVVRCLGPDPCPSFWRAPRLTAMGLPTTGIELQLWVGSPCSPPKKAVGGQAWPACSIASGHHECQGSDLVPAADPVAVGALPSIGSVRSSPASGIPVGRRCSRTARRPCPGHPSTACGGPCHAWCVPGPLARCRASQRKAPAQASARRRCGQTGEETLGHCRPCRGRRPRPWQAGRRARSARQPAAAATKLRKSQRLWTAPTSARCSSAQIAAPAPP